MTMTMTMSEGIQVNFCEICGSNAVGFQDILVTCCQCSSTHHVHLFCMKVIRSESPDNWICDLCLPKNDMNSVKSGQSLDLPIAPEKMSTMFEAKYYSTEFQNQSALDAFLHHYGIPVTVQSRLASTTERACDRSVHKGAWSLAHFEAGVLLPLHQYYIKFLTFLQIAPFQLNPNAYRLLTGLYVMYRQQSWPEPTPEEILYMAQLKPIQKTLRDRGTDQRADGYFGMQKYSGKLLDHNETKARDATRSFFFTDGYFADDAPFPLSFRRIEKVERSKRTEKFELHFEAIQKLPDEARDLRKLVTTENLRRCGLISSGQQVGKFDLSLHRAVGRAISESPRAPKKPKHPKAKFVASRFSRSKGTSSLAPIVISDGAQKPRPEREIQETTPSTSTSPEGFRPAEMTGNLRTLLQAKITKRPAPQVSLRDEPQLSKKAKTSDDVATSSAAPATFSFTLVDPFAGPDSEARKLWNEEIRRDLAKIPSKGKVLTERINSPENSPFLVIPTEPLTEGFRHLGPEYAPTLGRIHREMAIAMSSFPAARYPLIASEDPATLTESTASFATLAATFAQRQVETTRDLKRKLREQMAENDRLLEASRRLKKKCEELSKKAARADREAKVNAKLVEEIRRKLKKSDEIGWDVLFSAWTANRDMDLSFVNDPDLPAKLQARLAEESARVVDHRSSR